ncbi:MAG: anthranilate synthase component II [Bacteroidales bacterium]
MRTLIIDNYDSFTYNLVHLVKGNVASEVSVIRNDELSIEDVDVFDNILLSPGPGLPSESGLLVPIIEKYKNSKPMLGVCLGMQAIGEVFGAKLINLDKPLHGIGTPITHDGSCLFDAIPQTFEVGRYHSWIIDSNTLSKDLKITAKDADGQPMALEHNKLPIFAVQFHPESILTEYGRELIINFFEIYKKGSNNKLLG